MVDPPARYINQKAQNSVAFEEICKTYPIFNDIVVDFTFGTGAKGSSKDWLGIYEEGWKELEQPLAFEWGLGRPRENTAKKRRIVFKKKYLDKAESKKNYQFVYINKYLEILGESSYFQFSENTEENVEPIKLECGPINEVESTTPNSGTCNSVSSKQNFTSIQEELRFKLEELCSNEGLRKRMSKMEYLLEIPHTSETFDGESVEEESDKLVATQEVTKCQYANQRFLKIMPGVIQPIIDPLDTLEAQIRELESKIIGNAEVNENEGPVIDSLAQSNTNLSSSVSNYDAIKTVFDRINQLDAYLDPTYEDFLTDSTIKTKMILESEADLKELLTQLIKLNELNNVLDSEKIKNVPKLKDQLGKITEAAVKNQDLCVSVRDKVNDLMQSYNSVVNNMTRAFAQFDAIVTQLENEAQPKKIID